MTWIFLITFCLWADEENFVICRTHEGDIYIQKSEFNYFQEDPTGRELDEQSDRHSGL